MEREQKKENIWNTPNALTLSRVIITFVMIYFIFADFDISYIIVAFVVGMITDALDGQVARRFGLTTEFGRKFDVIADRILILGVALSFIIKFSLRGILTRFYILQICLILSREIITLPFVLIAVIFRKGIPKVRFIGKLTTVMQAVVFPIIVLSIFYPVFNFSIYFAVLTGLSGLVASFYYISDIRT